MPYCDGDPPPHCSAGQLRPQAFFLGSGITVGDTLTSSWRFRISQDPPVRRSWRWRTTALMALATLFIFSTMESAFAEASLNIGGCTNKDISIFQSPDGSSGIPRYAVQIMNNCMSDCSPSDIHVFCGWFASALLVNPNSFKRIAFDDCLVNGGRPLRRGETLRFTYANSFMYPLRFKSASFCK